jgi:hypothetical protein
MRRVFGWMVVFSVVMLIFQVMKFMELMAERDPDGRQLLLSGALIVFWEWHIRRSIYLRGTYETPRLPS